MKIGVIGAGHIGATLARHFARAGHEVGLSNSRGRGSLEPLVRSIGPNAYAMTVEGAARFAEVVLLAVPWRKPEAFPPAELLAGKVVIDAMNPYGADGEVIDLGEDTSSEQVAMRLPGALIVKAFNTMYYHTLATEARGANTRTPHAGTRSASGNGAAAPLSPSLSPSEGERGTVRAGEGHSSDSPNPQPSRGSGPDRLVIFVAGDDLSAKQIVSRLIEQIGFAAVDTGSLREGGRKQQPGSPIYNRPMTLAQAREALSDFSEL
jgi:predicted dinucleotide-binding enzyme